MEPILVTGGAGYIGSQTCKALFSAGFLPIVYDNLSTGHAYAVKWGPLIEGELMDRKRLDDTFKTYEPKAVLHFAADAIVSESMHLPGKYYGNNVGSTVSLLETMRQYSVSSLVFSSTCATYGIPKKIPITEMEAQNPINPYGNSKWMVEKILKDFETAHGTKYVSLRYFNAAGADLSTEIGENHFPETHLIPTIIQTALGLKKQTTVYGADFPTRDGSAVRDYIHVQDLADAHVLALKWLLANKRSESINLGTGAGYSVFEIIHAIQEFAGKIVSVKVEPRRAGEPPQLTAENTKALKLLNWEPKIELPTIIESAWKWHQHLIKNKVQPLTGSC